MLLVIIAWCNFNKLACATDKYHFMRYPWTARTLLEMVDKLARGVSLDRVPLRDTPIQIMGGLG